MHYIYWTLLTSTLTFNPTLQVFFAALPNLVSGVWLTKVVFWNPDGVFKCLPIFSLAFSCQTFVDFVSSPWYRYWSTGTNLDLLNDGFVKFIDAFAFINKLITIYIFDLFTKLDLQFFSNQYFTKHAMHFVAKVIC